MKQPLIELIVQAVKAEFEKEFYEKEQVFWPSQIESMLRAALASIPEMPQVDELIKYAQHLETCDFEFYESGIHPCTCGLDKLLTSPPTKTE